METSEVPEKTSVATADRELETTSQNVDGSSVHIAPSCEDNGTSSEDVEATGSSMGISSSDDKIFTYTTDVTSSKTLAPIPNLDPSSPAVENSSEYEEISTSGEEATITGESTDVQPSGSGNPESLTTTPVASITSVSPNCETGDTFSRHVETSSSIAEGTVTDDRLLHSRGSRLLTTTVATSSTFASPDSETVIYRTNVETSSSIEEDTDGATDESTDVEPYSTGGLNSFTMTLTTSSTPAATDIFSAPVETSSSVREGPVTGKSTDVQPTCDGCTEISFKTTVTASISSGITEGGTTNNPSSDVQSSHSVFPSEAFMEVTLSTSIQTTSSVSAESETSTTPITPIVDVVEQIIDTLEKHPVSHVVAELTKIQS